MNNRRIALKVIITTRRLVLQNNILYFGIFSYLFCFLLRLPVSLVKYVFAIEDVNLMDKISHKAINLDLILDALCFAPIVETLLFQGVFYLIYKYWIRKFGVIVFLSGIVFGSIHHYSVFYMMNTFLIGIYFMYAYLLRAKYQKSPFLAIGFAHFLINLITLIFTYFKYGFEG